VKGRMASQLIFVIGLILISAAVAHAGAGGGAGAAGTALTTGFECYFVYKGAPSNQVVDISDGEFGLDAHQNVVTQSVHLGSTQMMCTPVQVEQDGTDVTIDPTPGPRHLKCYNIPSPDSFNPTGPGPTFGSAELHDPFGVETVTMTSSKFLCLPATTGLCDKPAGCPAP